MTQTPEDRARKLLNSPLGSIWDYIDNATGSDDEKIVELIANVIREAGKEAHSLGQQQGMEEAAKICKLVLHAAVIRSLDEAGVKNEVLRGMCIEVSFEKFDDEFSKAAKEIK